jgi:hypothetical protein
MKVTETFNIQNINSDNTSLAKVLFVFYVLIASGYTDSLLSKQMREYIQDNKFMQHFIGFMTMIVLITFIGGVTDTKSIIFYSLIAYTWFILSTKLDIHWNMAILLLLFIGYIYENDMMNREIEIKNDKNLSDDEKKKIIENDNQIKVIIVGIIIVVTIVGTLFYSYKKHEQYGGGYDIFEYILN